jgi:hypothetical protein
MGCSPRPIQLLLSNHFSKTTNHKDWCKIRSRNYTCTQEVLAEAEYIYAHNGISYGIGNAIGFGNPQSDLAVAAAAFIASNGTGPATDDKVQASCAAKSNPVLLLRQVNALMQLSSVFDVLSEFSG